MSDQHMSTHASEWLHAYHDGELHGRKLERVEAHLADCPACRGELAELEALSKMLQADLLPEISTAPEQFVAQVGLRLPRRVQPPASRNAGTSRAWSLVPLVVLLLVGFFRSVVFVTDLLTWVEQLGINPQAVSWLVPTQETIPNVFQQLSSLALDWGTPFNNTLLGDLTVPLIFAGCYLLWLVLWWLNQDQNGKEVLPDSSRS